MSIFAAKPRIAVFRGGAKDTYQTSLKSGSFINGVLADSGRYQPLDVVVSNAGEWLVDGRVANPASLLAHIDAAYIAIVGQYGEDGILARVLEQHGIPHQTSRPYAALETWQKHLATDKARQAGMQTPRRVVVYSHGDTDLHRLSTQVHDSFGPHYVVKPLSGTQRADVHYVDTAAQLPGVIKSLLGYHNAVIVEEYVAGTPVTLASVPGLREQQLYHTPVNEWRHTWNDSNQLEQVDTVGPAHLPAATKTAVTEATSRLYQLLGVAGLVRSDFQVTPEGNLYYLESNTISPLTADSALATMFAEVGVSPEELVTHQINRLR
jgi:D-alanine-D-alanine ligase